VGVRAGQVFAVFLAKALVVGLIGAVVGYAAGLAIAAVWDAYEAGAAGAVGLAALWMPGLALAVLAAAPLVSAAASLVPAMTAAGQDPALVLREE
jgi:ABC-type lipoprotein release transport system permease subunit